MGYCNPGVVIPRSSPVLAPVRPRWLKPAPLCFEGESDDETDFEDIIDSDAHCNPDLRDRKRPHGQDDDEQFGLRIKKLHPASWKDPINVQEMDTRRDCTSVAETARAPLPPPGARLRSRRKRFGLPLFVARPSGRSNLIMACPDSGSDENIMSLELANVLGLKTEKTSSGEPRQFTVANGNVVTAVGQVSTWCSFAISSPSETMRIECIFHVFTTLAVPMIMGVDFLQQTETLSKHRNRLVEQPVPALQALRLNSVGRPRRSLICQVDAFMGCATVDTGSDLDLVSPAFAKSRAYKIEAAFEKVEFADCSVGYTSGVVKTPFVVGTVNSHGFCPRGEPIDLELFVLNDLNADILIGQATVDALDVFNLHNESLIPSMPRLGESDLNIIRHIGRLEQGVANVWDKVKRNLGGNSSGSSDEATGRAEAQVDIHQRENARREHERARIEKLSGSDRQRAQELEDMAIQAFESERQRRRLNDNTSHPIEGEFRCTFAGCTALPFQTQYLLSSHAVTHLARPHYCTVKGCPSKGEKGFKSRDDLIHHRIIHHPTGYVCPFCPDGECTYLRQGKLKRHVRVHHVDKDKDDPVLQQALNEPIVRPNRGRRRRRRGPSS